MQTIVCLSWPWQLLFPVPWSNWWFYRYGHYHIDQATSWCSFAGFCGPTSHWTTRTGTKATFPACTSTPWRGGHLPRLQKASFAAWTFLMTLFSTFLKKGDVCGCFRAVMSFISGHFQAFWCCPSGQNFNLGAFWFHYSLKQWHWVDPVLLS